MRFNEDPELAKNTACNFLSGIYTEASNKDSLAKDTGMGKLNTSEKIFKRELIAIRHFSDLFWWWNSYTRQSWKSERA